MTASTQPPAALEPAFKQELDVLHTTMCKALNDPKRMAILYLLREGPLAVGALADALGVSHANVSQHLAVLRDRGLVDGDRQGTTVAYSLTHPRVLEALDTLREVLREEVSRRGQAVSGNH